MGTHPIKTDARMGTAGVACREENRTADAFGPGFLEMGHSHRPCKPVARRFWESVDAADRAPAGTRALTSILPKTAVTVSL